MSDPLDKSIDPDIRLEAMKERSLTAADDLIPILMEKAVNGKSKDTLAIFEALADRGGFNKPEVAQPQGPQFNLTFNASDMAGMLQGLKTITGGPQTNDFSPAHQIEDAKIMDKI